MPRKRPKELREDKEYDLPDVFKAWGSEGVDVRVVGEDPGRQLAGEFAEFEFAQAKSFAQKTFRAIAFDSISDGTFTFTVWSKEFTGRRVSDVMRP